MEMNEQMDCVCERECVYGLAKSLSIVCVRENVCVREGQRCMG